MTTTNTHLADPEFWVEANGSEVLAQIAELEAIKEPTKVQQRKLVNARSALARVRDGAVGLAKANARWQAGVEGKVSPKVMLTADDTWADDLCNTPVVEGVRCHYCGGPVDNITGTAGQSEPRFTRSTEVYTVGGELVAEEKLSVSVSKVLACYKCCLKVKKPIIATRV